jgi:hypothetical protein
MDARIKSAHDASGASSVLIIPVCTMPSSFPRRVFCARAFATLLRSPRIEGSGAPRDVRVQRHPLGVPHASKTRVNALMTPHARRLARRLASHDAGRSPLGAPPWRFWARGRASLTGICAGSVTASSSHPGRSAWSATSRASRASGYEPPPQDATPRSAFRIVSGDAPQ